MAKSAKLLLLPLLAGSLVTGLAVADSLGSAGRHASLDCR